MYPEGAHSDRGKGKPGEWIGASGSSRPSPQSRLPWQVPAGGGTPEPMTTLDESQGESNHEWPELLPGGEAVLFTIRRAGEAAEAAQIAVRHLGTGEQRVLVSGGSYPMYVPTGHLVYAVAGTLRAVPFDLDRLAVTGIPVGVLEGVLTKAGSGAADVAVARDGSLVYVAGEASDALHTLVWVDREGREEPVAAEPRRYRNPAVSPDGTRVAVTVLDPEDIDLWIWNLGRETLQRLTFDEGADRHPVWTPDGSRVVCSSSRVPGEKGTSAPWLWRVIVPARCCSTRSSPNHDPRSHRTAGGSPTSPTSPAVLKSTCGPSPAWTTASGRSRPMVGVRPTGGQTDRSSSIADRVT